MRNQAMPRQTRTMPLQSLVSEPALSKVANLRRPVIRASTIGDLLGGPRRWHDDAIAIRRQVVYDFMEDFLKASERLNGFVDEA